MIANNKDRYRKLCEERNDIPLFLQAWWLDGSCGIDNWKVALSVAKDGKIQGALPWFYSRNKGLRMIHMPRLTPYMGPWLLYPNKLKKKYSFEKRVLDDLMEQLPKTDFYFQDFTVDFTNWLPFYWKGYRQTTRYTYLFDDLSDIDQIYASLNSSVRNKIRKAEGQLVVSTDSDIKAFYELNSKTFARQQMNTPYPLAFLQGLDKALEQRQQRRIYVAKDAEGRAHAGLYLVWDHQTAYNLMLGADTQLRTSGAVQLLLWQAIKDAAEMGLRFDFEGSMIPAIESLFRSFAARQQPYFRVYKGRNRFLELMKDLFAKW